MRRMLVALILASSVLTASAAAEETYQTSETRSFAVISQRIYGDARWADLIASHNQLTGEVAPGTKLRVPSAIEHAVEPGDSWASLAERYWQDASLARDLAVFTGAHGAAHPPAGQTLRVPMLVRYRIRRGETMAALARRFYSDVSFAVPLAQLNRILEPQRLAIGTTVRVPLTARARDLHTTSPQITSAPPVAAGPTSVPADPDLEQALRAASNAYLDGDFDTARSSLEDVRAAVLSAGTPTQRENLLRQLISVYVAYDLSEPACRAHAALIEIRPDPYWDPQTTSPKILRAIAACDLN